MPFAPFKNYQIEYTTQGNGQGLVLVHGTGQTAANTWADILPHFTENWQVICPNFSGSGQTPLCEEKLNLDLLAEQVLTAASHAGLKSFNLVGHSLGACVAMQIAAKYPEKVNKLALLAGFASGQTPRLQLQFKMWHKLATSNPEALAEIFIYSALSPAFIDSFSNEEIEGFVAETHQSTNWQGTARQIEVDLDINLLEKAKTIKHRTLITGCLQDYILPVYHSKELAKIIQNSTYTELDCGHAAPMEKAAEYTILLKNFLLSN